MRSIRLRHTDICGRRLMLSQQLHLSLVVRVCNRRAGRLAISVARAIDTRLGWIGIDGRPRLRGVTMLMVSPPSPTISHGKRKCIRTTDARFTIVHRISSQSAYSVLLACIAPPSRTALSTHRHRGYFFRRNARDRANIYPSRVTYHSVVAIHSAVTEAAPHAFITRARPTAYLNF